MAKGHKGNTGINPYDISEIIRAGAVSTVHLWKTLVLERSVLFQIRRRKRKPYGSWKILQSKKKRMCLKAK